MGTTLNSRSTHSEDALFIKQGNKVWATSEALAERTGLRVAQVLQLRQMRGFPEYSDIETVGQIDDQAELVLRFARDKGFIQ